MAVQVLHISGHLLWTPSPTISSVHLPAKTVQSGGSRLPLHVATDVELGSVVVGVVDSILTVADVIVGLSVVLVVDAVAQ